MINAEGELHALDNAASMLVNLAVAFLFSSPLLDHVGGMKSGAEGSSMLLVEDEEWLATEARSACCLSKKTKRLNSTKLAVHS